jgi:hypothetical protein
LDPDVVVLSGTWSVLWSVVWGNMIGAGCGNLVIFAEKSHRPNWTWHRHSYTVIRRRTWHRHAVIRRRTWHIHWHVVIKQRIRHQIRTTNCSRYCRRYRFFPWCSYHCTIWQRGSFPLPCWPPQHYYTPET